MNNELTILNTSVEATQSEFTKLAELHNSVDFEIEKSFAIQSLWDSKKNEMTFLGKIAKSNPQSLQYAMYNVASIGLTLNPVKKFAYLIPRAGSVTMDISYMGMVHLACESGAMKWVQVELVYENDTFQFQGVGEKPIHKSNPFKDRGNVIGVYCVAKTEDSEYLTEIMNVTECYSIRDRSEAWKRNQSGPWKTDEGEMMKKTVIKRAFKLWPKNDKLARLGQAIDLANQSEGINFKEEAIEVAPSITETQYNSILDLLIALEKKEDDGFYKYVSGVCKREISNLKDLDTNEASVLITQLKQFSPPKENDNENTKES